jgi:CheY-like chemotaxis protein
MDSNFAGSATVPRDNPHDMCGRVLIVDDDPNLRMVFQRQLESGGFAVVAAASGAEGLSALRRDPKIGLVLLDLMMPDMDGWRFRHAQASEERLASVPTIVVTGSPLHTIVDAELNAAAYLLKPVGREHLLSVVRSHVVRRHPEM